MKIVKLILVVLVLIVILYLAYIKLIKKEPAVVLENKTIDKLPVKKFIKPAGVSYAGNSSTTN